ncbi:TIGR00296 family protein [Nitrososphaera viennensis]|uniref:Protein NVIE_004510 n=2 Tax=Nitrososphaera viennensis TaxID=1034015 RepID=A0A060HH18_9ARCH|nr:TIGR00296 family protein [Nitrososphaera viennensis]AIC14645.1 AMMECR1 domain protein [Nitrososphaera viennensis EN76]UVS69610.1 TIGR00296 family protein [Nitrososphaera viennensis]
MISDAEGAELVRLARLAVEKYVTESVAITNPARELAKSGVFVTINNYHLAGRGEDLRGCIGFPLPYKGLHQSVIEAAIAAATQDPRFPPVDGKELEHLTFEVSVLTEPEEIPGSPAGRKKHVVIGRDGLLLKWKHGSGLLLPQVPVELAWDIDEYLANICYKAGAPPDAWLDPSSRLYTFQAQVFKEEKPRGNVVQLGDNNYNNNNNK